MIDVTRVAAEDAIKAAITDYQNKQQERHD
jgi:NifU-like protein involved in Fe-S cluster formation